MEYGLDAILDRLASCPRELVVPYEAQRSVAQVADLDRPENVKSRCTQTLTASMYSCTRVLTEGTQQARGAYPSSAPSLEACRVLAYTVVVLPHQPEPRLPDALSAHDTPQIGVRLVRFRTS